MHAPAAAAEVPHLGKAIAGVGKRQARRRCRQVELQLLVVALQVM